MAFTARSTPVDLLRAVVAAINLRQTEIVASFFHYDTTQSTTADRANPVVADLTIATANGTNAATNIVLANEMKRIVNIHFADDYAHGSAVSAAISTADATDDTTSWALANAIKAAYNTHLTASNVHANNDSTNAVTNADATDAATCAVVLNEMKGDYNAHVVSAPLGAMVRIVGA